MYLTWKNYEKYIKKNYVSFSHCWTTWFATMLTHFVSNSVILYFPCCFIGSENSEMSPGLFYCISEVAWKCQIDLFLFISSYLIAKKIWSNGPKGVGQQTSYSSVQLKQTGLLLVWHSQRSPFHHSRQVLLGFLLLYFQFPPFGYTRFKVGLVPTTSQWNWIQMGICPRLIDNYELYNSRLHCLCFSRSLPIIPSVIIRCRIFTSP